MDRRSRVLSSPSSAIGSQRSMRRVSVIGSNLFSHIEIVEMAGIAQRRNLPPRPQTDLAPQPDRVE